MVDVEGLKQSVKAQFPFLGLNKTQEIVRLVFEISKRDKALPQEVLTAIPQDAKTFPAIKRCLLEKRFPEALRHGEKFFGAFSALELKEGVSVDTTQPFFISPQNIYVEESVSNSHLAERLKKLFPSAKVTSMASYREFLNRENFSVSSYNSRAKNFFVVQERFDFFKKCPCTPGVVGCGYHNVNLGFGCPYECSYCFLQNYTNAPGIVFPANLDDFFEAFRKYPQNIRVGSGETTDSLVFDHITEFSPRIVDFFRLRTKSIFEFKTKSANVGLLLGITSSPNIVVGWSVNPQLKVLENEYFTAPLSERLAAAKKCFEAGYKVAFHFDPVFYYPGWDKDYAKVVEAIFSFVKPQGIAWISLGTLRMTHEQKKVIENRFPLATILNEELFEALDGKIRYPFFVRRDIYRFMADCIKAHDEEVPVYLCMEPREMWQAAKLKVCILPQ
ncbi:MAG: hypothetical protein HQL16_00075 [Candidatus Omnitrophica bacterium]|nr:hypothetical protein [Candidatus Omnitrophota bacterium]